MQFNIDMQYHSMLSLCNTVLYYENVWGGVTVYGQTDPDADMNDAGLDKHSFISPCNSFCLMRVDQNIIRKEDYFVFKNPKITDFAPC